MIKNILPALGGTFLLSAFAYGQCSFTGLPFTMCESDAPVTLVGSGPGLFSGNGVSGNTFDPAAAGPGVHVVNYDESDPTVYTIDQGGTFAPLPSMGTGVILSDDQVSTSLPIGFSFNFFGTTYTDFYISSNGFITFSSTTYNGCCSGATLPMADGVDNIIAWGWNDLYPPGNGSITYETVGTAPNRKLLVNFVSQWHCCSGPATNSAQIILNETSNIIEIHTAEVTNDGSSCTQGIENFDGTIAYSPAGRNSTMWTLTNDYVAFIPQMCNASSLVQVLASPNVIGTATPNPVCSGETTVFTGGGALTYTWDQGVSNGAPFTASASDVFIVTGTNADGCMDQDTVYLVVNPTPTITLSANDEMFGNDGSINLTIWSGAAPFTFDWDNDGTGDNDDNNDLYGVSAGTYTVTMTDGNGCTVTATATIGSQVGLEELNGLAFTLHPNPSNGQFSIEFDEAVLTGDLQLLVVDALGRRVYSQEITEAKTLVNLGAQNAGTYFVKVLSPEGAVVRPLVVK
jgi:hypothetical protein